MTDDWTSIEPTVPGQYLFFGHDRKNERGSPPKFYVWEVWQVANGSTTTVCGGLFMYGGHSGIWKALNFIPSVPSKENP